MKNLLYLALKFLNYYRFRTAILILALTSLFFLPLAVRLVIHVSEDFLSERSDSTPLVIGAGGSELDLVMAALYFRNFPDRTIPYGILTEFKDLNLGAPVPLHTAFSVRNVPVVGTTPSYFKYRDLELEKGRWPLTLGECVIGSRAADRLSVNAGDLIITDSENPYQLAGSYPLQMKVTGILAPRSSWDDRSIFTDIKTTWVIQGLGHGHEDLNKSSPDSLILRTEDEGVVANSSVRLFNRISEENRNNFHFHGGSSTFPMNALLFFPTTAKSQALVLARYEDSPIQVSEPRIVIGQLLETLFRISEILNSVLLVTLSVTAVAVVFILTLTIRMRKKESLTLYKIGGSSFMTLMLTAVEMILLCLISLVLTGGFLWLTWIFRDIFLEMLVK